MDKSQLPTGPEDEGRLRDVDDGALLALKGHNLEAAMVNSIKWLVLDHTRRTKRMNKLRMFGDKKSELQRTDTVEIELMLTRRDDIAQIKVDLARLRESLADCQDPETLASVYQSIARLNAMMQNNMTAIEKAMDVAAKREASREGLMATLLAQKAKLAQEARHHKDKLDVAKEKQTDADLVDRLCAKYRMSKEDVYAKILRRPMPVESEIDGEEVA